jgi:hypothetical protein
MAKIEPIIYAGYSRDKVGKMRFRTATTSKRVYQLEALGEEVHMVIINDVYSKSAAAKELLRIDHANGAKELEAFYTAQVRDENPFKKTTRVVKVKVPNKAMVHLVGAKAEVEELSTAEARKIRNEWNRKHAHLSYDGE